MAIRVLPLGLDDLLVEFDDLATTLAALEALAAEPPPGVVELVPAARTLRVGIRRNALSPVALDRIVRLLDLSRPRPAPGGVVEIPVRYDGEDLPEVARLTGLAVEELVRRHEAAEYTVAFTGFAPGFAYLAGGDPALEVPRRSSPRPRIPAGALGLAGAFSGVYPRVSPGGWQLIGTALVPMWDERRAEPALLAPGMRVRFRRVDGAGPEPEPERTAHPGGGGDGHDDALLVRAPGPQALIEDLGRPHAAARGVSRSGAADRAALREANRLVGNPPEAAAIEFAYGGLEVRARGERLVAIAGAPAPAMIASPHLGEIAAPHGSPFVLLDGETLVFGAPRRGIRSYLAVRGGLDAVPVLGSRASDTLARLGPPPLVEGVAVPVRPVPPVFEAVGLPDRDEGGREPGWVLPAPGEEVVLDIVLGPRDDWFDGASLARLASEPWQVSARSDRVGIRLEGEPLARAARRDGAELPSEPMVPGAIQVPPDGRPIIFLVDHPVTGGYPVVGVVATRHLDLAGQLPAGAVVRFRPVPAIGLATGGVR